MLSIVGFSFTIEKRAKKGLARAGVIETPHGKIETPAFVPVATKATVKAMTLEMLKDVGARVVLSNTYHLYLEPGEKLIKKAGGLGKFMNWDGPTMTDSGGFQVFSLGTAYDRKVNKFGGLNSTLRDESGVRLAEVYEEGVTFKSVIDGSSHRFTPERAVDIQHSIGADIIFAFDECPSPDASKKYQLEAMERTHRWALRSLERHKELQSLDKARAKKCQQMLFGIVQGGRFEDLRKKSARFFASGSSAIGEFDGFGIGGSFEKKDMGTAVKWVNEILPEEKPRHLLGIGAVEDLFLAVENGCDTFDCVLPTRLARNGSLYTFGGRINILNSRFKKEFKSIDPACDCYTCANYSLAYLAHLYRVKEILAATLGTIHNLRFIIHLVDQMREAIFSGKFLTFKGSFLRRYGMV